ncbi:MAG: FAD/NAD(P)-binding protein [Rudaea sp.]|nr:FAD/NAD(P)-binding protein [Rudaea sp.]
MQRIAIIGGGAAGAATVGEFLRGGGSNPVALTWVVGRRAPGRGVAYATRNDQHLLNVRTANMGLFVDDTGGLLRFAKTRGLAAEATGFLPRAVFGDYVESTLAQLMSSHATGCTIDVHSTEATALHPRAGGGYHVRAESGAMLSVDAVVLAIGAPPPVALPQVGAETVAGSGYLLDPWNLPRLAQVPRRVIVLGSGLTAADVVLSVASAWPDAQIVALSRHGCLPAAHRTEPCASYVHQAGLVDALRAQPDARRWLRLIRATVSVEGSDWRSVIDSIRPATVGLWQSLDSTQRRRFLRHARWLWELARHRMPPQTAEAIEQLREEGRLELVAGRVHRIEGQAPLAVTFRRRDDGTAHTLLGDLVIQATGFQAATVRTPHRLMRQLLATGLVRIDPLELGLETTADGRPLSANGSATPDLRVIGALLRGALWECTALPEIRATAAKLARELAADLRRRHAPDVHPPRSCDRGPRYNDMSIHQFDA